MTDTKTGTGPAIKKGQTAVVHYTGWLYDEKAPEKKGKKFDSSRERKQPVDCELGAGMGIQGWDEGVEGMQVGGQRRLVIAPEKGYGAQGAGGNIIAAIAGSVTNVIGLPMERTTEVLAQVGIRPLSESRPQLPEAESERLPAHVSAPDRETRR